MMHHCINYYCSHIRPGKSSQETCTCSFSAEIALFMQESDAEVALIFHCVLRQQIN